MDFTALVSNCDALVRSGQVVDATAQLSALNTARVPRKFRLSLASLCRRVGLVAIGLRLLTPVIYPAKARASDATPHEKAEYAVLLQRSGVVGEAQRILEAISVKEVPDVPLYICACLFNVWDHARAATVLENYIASSPAAYMALVARVNLASALISTDKLDHAFQLLSEIDELASQQGAIRLRANCQEMLAQIHIFRADYAAAQMAIQQAGKLLGSAQTHDQLFILKWQAVLEGLSQQSTAPLHAFRQVAVARKESEAIRDADLYTLMIEFNPELFEQLYFGTPFGPYRDRICRVLKCTPPVESPYFGTRNTELTWDLRSPDNKIDFVILSLLQDFYRPAQIGTLFSTLFKGEYFNVFSAPGRVRQLLYRARKWLEHSDKPLVIEELDSRYMLHAFKPIHIALPLNDVANNAREKQLQILRGKLPALTNFSAKDAKDALGVSTATSKRVLLAAVESGQLERYGAGSATRYFFAEKKTKKPA